jgi:type I restriction enzyme M protein
MANYPFSQENWWKNGEPKKDKKGKPVTKKAGSPQLEYPGKEDFNDPYNRFDYGIPPFSNGDFAFLQHIIASVNENGKAGVVCPQGVLFRGQPEKTEEEDGQNRKADDEYLIRRGFLQGPVNKDGEFVRGVNIIDAIVVLPGNLFYGTTIPGSIVFINKNKAEERKDKVLMVYAAKKGWYKEESNMNVLLPQDILRISTILESWGDIEVAKEWITSQKARLRELIQEELDFKKSEIELDTQEELEFAEEKFQKAEKKVKGKEEEGKKPTKTELNNLEKAKDAYGKLIAQKEQRIIEAEEQAEKERLSIDEVEIELLAMLTDPELRKRYFSVVDLEELEENEFNLNIPRYVDTFEPEEEVDLGEAIMSFEDAVSAENEIIDLILKLKKTIEV